MSADEEWSEILRSEWGEESGWLTLPKTGEDDGEGSSGEGEDECSRLMAIVLVVHGGMEQGDCLGWWCVVRWSSSRTDNESESGAR